MCDDTTELRHAPEIVKLRRRRKGVRKAWHGYYYPEYDQTDGYPNYRFEWYLFGEAVICYRTNPCYQPSVYCYFSRVSLSDRELKPYSVPHSSVTASSCVMPSENLEVNGTEIEPEKLQKTNEEKLAENLGGSESSDESTDTDIDSDEEIARKMASLNLPTSFGDTRRNREMRYDQRGREHRRGQHGREGLFVRDKSPYFESFSDYFEQNGNYLHRKSWLYNYPEYFCTPKDAKAFDEVTERDYAPMGLLKEHKDMATFNGISYPADDPTYPYKTCEEWDALYERHWYAVQEHAKQHFCNSEKRRCLEFPKKLARVGLIYKAEKEGDDNDEEEKSSVSEQKSSDVEQGTSKGAGHDGLGEFTPCVPNDTDMNGPSVDIQYDFKIPREYVCKKRRSRRKMEPKKSAEIKTADTDDADDFSIVEPESASPQVRESLHVCDFSYNEERDKWLLAKNALKTFADDKDMPKYYNQRFRLFSRLNEGILMDLEGWYSVTPEKIAAHISDRVVIKKDALVLDGFAGVGGNSIQFAQKGAYVIALDMDPVRLRCAKRNAEIYGVADRITFICTDYFHFCKHQCNKVKRIKVLSRGFADMQDWYNYKKKTKLEKAREDGFEIVKMEKSEADNDEETDSEDDLGIAIDSWFYRPAFDAVFLSPPWGGPDYRDSKIFSLNDMEPDGYRIFHAARKLTHNIAYYLPKQTDSNELIRLARNAGGAVEIEQAELNGKVKAITAYYGELLCYSE